MFRSRSTMLFLGEAAAKLMKAIVRGEGGGDKEREREIRREKREIISRSRARHTKGYFALLTRKRRLASSGFASDG